MLLDPSEQNQLIVIFSLAVILFIIASALPARVSTVALLLLVPYQTIETRFGSSSMVLAFVVFIALILKRERVQLPMLPQFAFLLLWYLISMSMMAPSTYVQHGSYLLSLVSAFLVFWLCYNLTQRFKNTTSIIDVFIVMNVFVAIYCAIQLWVGPGERLVMFNISEMSMHRVRGDGRLMGPFQSAEITALYFVLMQFVILHQFWYSTHRWYRRALIGLAAINLGFLVTTGSRGEFLLLLGGAGVYLWLFRRRLGVMRAIGLAVGGTVALVVMALVVINFTQFGGLFDRLRGTEFDSSGIPDTRQVLWREAWAEIKSSPIVGHGPRFRFHLEDRGARYEDHVYIQYPHNLYMFLLFTVGVPGLILFLWILLIFLMRCWRAMSCTRAPPYDLDLARTGFIVTLLFMIDGLKIDQMRLNLADFWHFSFGLWGVMMAVCAKVLASERQNFAEPQRVPGDALPNAVFDNRVS